MIYLRNLGVKFVSVLGTVIFLFLTLASWRYTLTMHTGNELLTIGRDSVPKTLLFVSAFLIVCALFGKLAERLKERTLTILAAILCLAVMAPLFYVASRDYFRAVADQMHIFVAAEDIFDGTISQQADYDYLRAFPFQLHTASVFALIFSLAGKASYVAIECAHIFFLGLSLFTGYHIVKELFPSKKVQAVYLLSAFTFLPSYIYAFFIYGESLCVSFGIFSIYFYIKAAKEEAVGTRTALFWILTAFCLFVAFLMRPSMMIVGIAFVIERVLHCMQARSPKQLLPLLLVLTAVFAGKQFLFLPLQASSGIDLNGGYPTVLGITMGLQYGDPSVKAGPGSYNGYPQVIYVEQCHFDAEAAEEIGIRDLKERIAHFAGHPAEALSFFKEKAMNQWTEPSYGAFTMTRAMNEPPAWLVDLYGGRAKPYVYGFMDLWQSAAYLFLFLAFVFLFFKKSCPQAVIFALILIGGFLFTLIWEAKSRYAYPYVALSLPLISASVVWTLEKLRLLFAHYLKLSCKKFFT